MNTKETMRSLSLFKTIVGSRAYGTATETSDTDHKGVYVQHPDEILSFDYLEQYELGKDECYYEIKRFLQLLQTANPTVLEMLYMPDDCIVEMHPAFQLLLAQRDRFLTTQCRNSFGGYAVAQIKKARGLDKKMNWEKEKVTRRTPFDFCYVYEDGKTMPISFYLEREKMKPELCGLVALTHFRDCYALYYDRAAHEAQESGKAHEPLGYRGIVLDDSNEVRLSSVPKEENASAIICFNKDGYSRHCKDYRAYTTWLEERNTQRYVEVAGHNQQIDGKNLLHCRRLLDMAMEIATEGTIRVRRPNADELLRIRRGEVQLDVIIAQAEQDIAEMDRLFDSSGLPDHVDRDFTNELLLEVRRSVEKEFLNVRMQEHSVED